MSIDKLIYKFTNNKFKKMNKKDKLKFNNPPRWHNLICMISFILFLNFNLTNAKGCQILWMDGKETAKCDAQGLISVPSGLSLTIHVIRLENNNFQILPSKVFQERGLVNLQKIFLSNCTLGMIAQDAFHQLNNLVELDLSQNLLTSVPSESFKNLVNVRRLLLKQNPIKTLRESSFASLIKLEHLDLSYCQIDQIEPGSFRSIQNLKSLKLNNNRLTTIASNVFVDIPPLYTIALENNLWNCDCELRPLHRWISENNMLLEKPQCKTPAKFENNDWSKMFIDDLACNPILLPTDTEISGLVGSNATFRCRIKSSPKPEVDWRIAEESNSLIPSNSQSVQPSPPYTLSNSYLNSAMQEERFLINEPIYENDGSDDIVVSTFTLINLQLEDAQRKFICKAKNKAGSDEEKFTISVYSASTGIKSGSISYTILMILIILFLIALISLFIFTRYRKQTKEGSNSNTSSTESKLDVLKNVKNSLVGNNHIKKSATSNLNTNNIDNNNKLHVKNDHQDLLNNQKLKMNDTNGTNGLYLNGYANGKSIMNTPDLMNGTNKFMNSNSNLHQFNQSNLSYAPNSNGLTVLNNSEMNLTGDIMNNGLLNYSSNMINVGPNDFTTNPNLTTNLASSQYGTSFAVQPNNLIAYQTNATGSNYLDTTNPGYLGSNEQLLNGFNNLNNYENMYSPYNQQQQYLIQQQNTYGTYVGNAPTELQIKTNPTLMAGDEAAIYYQNTLGKRSSPLISNNLSQNTLTANQAFNQEMSIYATLQHSHLQQTQTVPQHHVNILGQGSYIATQPSVVRYSPDDGFVEQTSSNSTNFDLEGTEV